MAINPEEQYPGKINPSDAEYPYGSARNITTPGDGTGTPWEAAIVNDNLGFQQAILTEAGEVPSGTPEKVGASQYLKSGKRVFGTSVSDYAELKALVSAQLKDGTIINVANPNLSGDFEVKTGTVTDNGGTLIVFTDDSNRYAQRIYQGPVSLEWFGVAMDGSVESSAGVVAALAAGNVKPSQGFIWVDPATPIVIETNKDKMFLGFATDILEFLTTIDDGRTIFKCSGQFNQVGDFSVNSKDATPKNFVAMELGSVGGGTSFTRSKVKTKVANCDGTGLDMRGWINNIEMLSIDNNLGFKGREINASDLTLLTERNIRGFDIEEILGCTFSNIMIEGTPSGTSQKSTIDNFRGLNIDSIYTEDGGWATSVLKFGDVVPGFSVNINAANITGSTLDHTAMVAFDNLQSVTANMDVAVGSIPAVVDFAAGCEYVDSKVVGTWSTPDASRNKPFTQDNSNSVQIHANYSGDTYLDHYLATFTGKTDANTVVTEENVNLRSGERGIKITANAGTHLAVTTLDRRVSHFDKVANLAGKTVKAFAWIFVPALTQFVDRTLIPAFGISAQGSSSSFPAAQRPMIAGQWNLVESEDLTIPWAGSGADRISFDFYVSFNSSTFNDSAHYIIVDSIFLTETKCNIRDIMQGRIRESAKYSGIKTDGDVLQIDSQTYQSLSVPHITLSQGEVRVWRPLPSAAGKALSVLVQGGVMDGNLGANALFKFAGAIDA